MVVGRLVIGGFRKHERPRSPGAGPSIGFAWDSTFRHQFRTRARAPVVRPKLRHHQNWKFLFIKLLSSQNGADYNTPPIFDATCFFTFLKSVVCTHWDNGRPARCHAIGAASPASVLKWTLASTIYGSTTSTLKKRQSSGRAVSPRPPPPTSCHGPFRSARSPYSNDARPYSAPAWTTSSSATVAPASPSCATAMSSSHVFLP